MNFNLRKQLQQNRDSDSTLGTPFTQEQEERLQELIRTEVFRVLGAGPSTPRARIGLDGEKDRLEEALRQAAERASTKRASDMQRLMQETSAAAAKEIKERHFTRRNLCSDAVDCVIPDATGLACVVAKPIALSERKPDESEKDDSGRCYYGEWEGTSWIWIFGSLEGKWSTHFLPAGVEALPATCFNPLED